MNKQDIGKGLERELNTGYDIVRISRWAFHELFNCRDVNSDEEETLLLLGSMEDDPQFELSEQQLHDLATKLITEGEKRHLGCLFRRWQKRRYPWLITG